MKPLSGLCTISHLRNAILAGTSLVLPAVACAEPPVMPSIANTPTVLAERKTWLLSQFQSAPILASPKTGMPVALARLYLASGKDPEALNYAANLIDFSSASDRPDRFGDLFGYPPLARFLYMYGAQLTVMQRDHLKHSMLTRIKDLREHGTENHAIMRAASIYLFAQYFPDEVWTNEDGTTYTSAALMADVKKRLLSRGRGFYGAGNNEVLSTTYAAINIYPLLNLVDFAADPDVRTAAEALVLYHMAQLAVNNYEGHIVAPLNRRNTQQARFSPPGAAKGHYAAVTQQIPWLYWGYNEAVPEDFTAGAEAAYAVMFALSDWRPPAALDGIASGAGTPYTIRSSIASFGYWGEGAPGETLRTVYRTPSYALGAGAQWLDPGGFYLDYDLFKIVWHSTDRFNYLEAFHPYWRSDKGEADWRHGMNSPFQQQAVHKNTAIVLFNIPAKDPWPGVGEKRWTAEREKHYDGLLQLAQLRFPESIDEWLQDGNWYFLREGEVYIGIRVLRDGSTVSDGLKKGGAEEFHVIKSEAAKTGFLFELGTAASHGSFSAFQKKLKSNPLKIDLDALDVTYTNSGGNVVRMQYNPDLTQNQAKRIGLFPRVWTNQIPIDYANWPLLDSPVATLKDHVLTFGTGAEKVSVDWRDEVPEISKATRAAVH